MNTVARNLYIRRRLVNGLAMVFSGAATIFGLFWLVWILWVTISKGIDAMSLQLFTEMTPPPGQDTGGLKNAIDWLVSGDLVIAKPIALVHASHRGDDMLASLRLVLSTISSRFNEELFLRFPFMKMEPEAIASAVRQPVNRAPAEAFLQEFARYCVRPQGDRA